MKYTLLRRKKSVFARNNVEFVDWMRKNDRQTTSDNTEFMQTYSYRKRTFEKIEICCKNEDEFVKDLQKNNLLLVEDKARGILDIFKREN